MRWKRAEYIASTSARSSTVTRRSIRSQSWSRKPPAVDHQQTVDQLGALDAPDGPPSSRRGSDRRPSSADLRARSRSAGRRARSPRSRSGRRWDTGYRRARKARGRSSGSDAAGRRAPGTRPPRSSRGRGAGARARRRSDRRRSRPPRRQPIRRWKRRAPRNRRAEAVHHMSILRTTAPEDTKRRRTHRGPSLRRSRELPEKTHRTRGGSSTEPGEVHQPAQTPHALLAGVGRARSVPLQRPRGSPINGRGVRSPAVTYSLLSSSRLAPGVVGRWKYEASSHQLGNRSQTHVEERGGLDDAAGPLTSGPSEWGGVRRAG